MDKRLIKLTLVQIYTRIFFKCLQLRTFVASYHMYLRTYELITILHARMSMKTKIRWWRVEFLLAMCALAWAAWQECQRPAWAEKIVLRARGSHASDFFSKRRKKCMQDLTSAPKRFPVECSISCHSLFETRNAVYGSKGRWSMMRRNNDP